MIATNISLSDVSCQIPCDISSQSSSSLPIKVKSMTGLGKMNLPPDNWDSNVNLSLSSSDECELEDLSDCEIHLDDSKSELRPTLEFESLRNIKEGSQSKQNQSLNDTTRNSQITLVENKRFLSNGHHPLRQSKHSRVARSNTSDVVTPHPLKEHTLFIHLRDRSLQTASTEGSPSRGPIVESPHKRTSSSTQSSSQSRTSSFDESKPRNHISPNVAIELMSQFLDVFGHLYTDSEACTLLKKCGDWTLLFEVSTLKSQEFLGMESFEGEDMENQKKYLEEVTAMIWDEEEDKVLLIPEKELTSQDRVQLRVIEKRKGLRAISNRKVFLDVLKKKRE